MKPISGPPHTGVGDAMDTLDTSSDMNLTRARVDKNMPKNVSNVSNVSNARERLALYHDLSADGVIVTRADAGDRLCYQTEDDRPPPADLIARLKEHKAALLIDLAGKRPRRGACCRCGAPIAPDQLYANCTRCALAAARSLGIAAAFSGERTEDQD